MKLKYFHTPYMVSYTAHYNVFLKKSALSTKKGLKLVVLHRPQDVKTFLYCIHQMKDMEKFQTNQRKSIL